MSLSELRQMRAEAELSLASVDALFDLVIGQVRAMTEECRALNSPPLSGGRRTTDPE